MEMPAETDLPVSPDTVFLKRIGMVLLAGTCFVGAILFEGSMQLVKLASVGEVRSSAPILREASLSNISDIDVP